MEITKHTGDNYGGICEIWIASGCNLPDVRFNSSVFRFASPKPIETFFDKVEFQRFSAKWKANEVETEHGTYYENEVTFKVSKFRPDVNEYLEKLQGKNIALMLVLQNSDKLIIGSKLNPLRLLTSFQTGSKPTDYNHYEFKIFGSTASRSAQLQVVEDVLGDFDTNDFDTKDFL